MRSFRCPCIVGAWGKLPHLPPPLWAALNISGSNWHKDFEYIVRLKKFLASVFCKREWIQNRHCNINSDK
jgi:hypothetical protein